MLVPVFFHGPLLHSCVTLYYQKAVTSQWN